MLAAHIYRPLAMRFAIALLLPLFLSTTAQAQRLVPKADPSYNLFSAALWTSEISKTLRSHWRRPVDAAPTTQPVIDIKVDRQGHVTGARVQSSSGNVTYDASVVHAIRKASPLPMPKDRAAYAPELRITFNTDRPIRILPVGFVPTTSPIARGPVPIPHALSMEQEDTIDLGAGSHEITPSPDGGYPTVALGATTPVYGPRGAPKAIGGSANEVVDTQMDRYRDDFTRLLNQFIRKPPGVRGGVLEMKITVQPDGSVSNVEVAGESLHNPELESRIFAKVRDINFGRLASAPADHFYRLRFF